MPHYTEYICADCNAQKSKDEADRGELVRKIITFSTFGPRPKIVKSITVKFICKACLQADADYRRAPHRGPGQRSAGLEKVRAAQALAASGNGVG